MAIKSETRLGPYEIVSSLGAGGMGEVYRARDPHLKRDVAIKVLPTAFSSDPERLHRFEQEAHAAAALNHPNILAVYYIGTQDGSPYIVSELLDGSTLREHLRTGPLPILKASFRSKPAVLATFARSSKEAWVSGPALEVTRSSSGTRNLRCARA